ncbi:unnamed protein product, partial [Mesorhabditis spiculigera]
MPRWENASEEFPKLDQLSGNGTFDVLVIGNSYVQRYRQWPEKVFRGRYRKFYQTQVTTCVPFLNYTGIDWQGPGCEKFSARIFDAVDRMRPKILVLILGYGLANDLITKHYDEMLPTAMQLDVLRGWNPL